ncbi:hypothetical protein EDC04DRAFT_1514878 [Pisolithus marmoratus]|nr:hypothetical protein EDC04DRAFT_1514878 [Pisolithus marmoratus]
MSLICFQALQLSDNPGGCSYLAMFVGRFIAPQPSSLKFDLFGTRKFQNIGSCLGAMEFCSVIPNIAAGIDNSSQLMIFRSTIDMPALVPEHKTSEEYTVRDFLRFAWTNQLVATIVACSIYHLPSLSSSYHEFLLARVVAYQGQTHNRACPY